MFVLVGRAWRTWQAKSKLLAPIWKNPLNLSLSYELLYPELQEVLKAGAPILQPYEGLAAVWEEYGSTSLPDYTTYLSHLARQRKTVYKSILDLACGTGLLTPLLSGVAGEVIGLDASERMLDFARARSGGQHGLTFVHGDFRNFDFNRQLDAVVCASNSLNYVKDRVELAQMFAAVSRNLRPGGVFVFDVTTEAGMQSLSGHYMHILVGDRRFAIHFRYDRQHRRESSLAILREGIETHCRIPLGPADVTAAVEGTGLVVEDYFSSALLPWILSNDLGVLFFVLSKKA